MVGRLREFLNQIEQNFPGAPPAANRNNENDENNLNEGDDDDLRDID